MRFRFEGHDKMGRPMKGELDAANQEMASAELRTREVFALKLEPVDGEPMRTVLEHPEEIPADVESEIEKVKAEADEEMPPCPADAHCPVCAPDKVVDEELSGDLQAAMRISGQIRDELGPYSDQIANEAMKIANEAMKEMVTEAACQAFNRDQVRRMPKGP